MSPESSVSLCLSYPGPIDGELDPEPEIKVDVEKLKQPKQQ